MISNFEQHTNTASGSKTVQFYKMNVTDLEPPDNHHLHERLVTDQFGGLYEIIGSPEISL